MGCAETKGQVQPDGQNGDGGEKYKNTELPKPSSDRGCTDILCLVLFIGHLFLYCVLSFYGAGDGNPSKLIAPRDSFGMYCGIKEQWSGYPAGAFSSSGSTLDLEGFSSMIYMLNVTATIDEVAKKFACSSLVETAITSGAYMTQAEFDAACKTGGTRDVVDGFSDWSSMGTAVTNGVEQFTDMTKVQDLLTGTGNSILSGSILDQITKYFVSTCVTGCGIATTPPISSARTYTYAPAPDAKWAAVWTAMTSDITNSNIRTSLEKFQFDALPLTECPYTEKFCVPLPGVEFTEISNGYCTIKISDSFDASEALSAIADSSLADSVEGGFDQAVGSIQTTWAAFIIVAVLTVVIGLIFLVLLRLFLAPIVWLAIILVGVLFIAAGGICMAYSVMCAGESLSSMAQDASTQINSTLTSTDDCAKYEIEAEGARTALMYLGIFCFVLSMIWACAICCLCQKIRLAIAINKVAAQFVYNTPHIVILPLVQFAIAIIYFVLWMSLASFILSQVPSGYAPEDAYESYDIAMGTDDTAGKCNDAWPSGGAWKAELDTECITNGKCWRCYPPRYIFDQRFAFAFFSFLWNNAFLVACGQCIIAGAVAAWFFRKDKADKTRSRATVCTGIRNCFRYHLGSLAFGSLILAIVQFVKYLCKYLEKQSKQQKNKIAECVFKVLGYLIWCFEKCIKYLNKNAYIQVALMGTNFCTSAKEAFRLIFSNAVRFGLLGGLGAVITIIGKYFIAISTAVLGFFVLQGMYPDIATPFVLVLLYFFLGYIVGSLFMNVFALAADTSLQCFIAGEEAGLDKEFFPPALGKFVDDHGSNSFSSGVLPT